MSQGRLTLPSYLYANDTRLVSSSSALSEDLAPPVSGSGQTVVESIDHRRHTHSMRSSFECFRTQRFSPCAAGADPSAGPATAGFSDRALENLRTINRRIGYSSFAYVIMANSVVKKSAVIRNANGYR